MTSLYICKGGTLVPRDPEKFHWPKPTVITYKHTIRQLIDNQCNCKEQKDRLIKEYEEKLAQKDGETMALVNRIADKEALIDELHSQIARLKTHQHTPIVKDQNIFQTQEGVWDRMQKTLNSTVISSFSLSDVSSSDLGLKNSRNQIQKTQKQMDDCFRKTNQLMGQIDGLMKKKRKYEFYHPVQVENSIIQELQNSQQNSQEEEKQEPSESQRQLEETFCRQSSEFNDFDSLDMTTFQSVQNFADSSDQQMFYSRLLTDSIQLKNAILQMREESMQELREIQQYYQKQLKISYEELEKERNKNALIQLTQSKLQQITNKGRQALAELDQNQELDSYVVTDCKSKSLQIINTRDENLMT